MWHVGNERRKRGGVSGMAEKAWERIGQMASSHAIVRRQVKELIKASFLWPCLQDAVLICLDCAKKFSDY